MAIRRRLARAQVKWRQHRELLEEQKLQQLRERRNKDIKAAKKSAELAQARQEAIDAQNKKMRAQAPLRVAKQAKRDKVVTDSQKAIKGLMAALKSLDKSINKPAAKTKRRR